MGVPHDQAFPWLKMGFWLFVCALLAVVTVVGVIIMVQQNKSTPPQANPVVATTATTTTTTQVPCAIVGLPVYMCPSDATHVLPSLRLHVSMAPNVH